MLAKLSSTLRRHHLLKKEDKVLVACSGGPDSVALLHLLHSLKDKYKLNLYLAHVNHKLRGRDSDQDEKFVKRLAKQFKIPVFLHSVNVGKLAKSKGLTLEETARQVRYEFLEKIARKHKLDKIATGHTLNDQAETVLMRLLRGSGPAGLAGIPIQRGKIIRPLLEISRAEILAYLRKNRIVYRIDKTNLGSDYLRNKIRNKLLPQLLKEYNPDLLTTLGKTAEILSEEQRYIQKKVGALAKKITATEKQKVYLDLKGFEKIPPILQRELVRLAYQRMSQKVYGLDFDQVERALALANSGQTGQRVNLKKNYWVEKGPDKLIFFCQVRKNPTLTLPLKKKVSLPVSGLTIESEILDRKKLPVRIKSANEKKAFLDYEKFSEIPMIRTWRPGDRFRPLGMKGTKKLSDFFTDLKVPRHLRENIPVLCSNGKIAWVVGYRISEDFKVRPRTKKVLYLQAQPLD